ncbi:MAG TPA: biopolymer transporter ExbD [Zoogloea sp.]|uniref:ExbD/TolR family protein n=1 Tax=Zoogloea sp. TaxID=49181 RepID=UPI002CF259B6|nr:biopolymer transporter ExbD [Zoogloea sp.]HMV16951.1 biopolymer transporter ExbD [Rhodocyclaceae bacterium]HMV62121.1 biopolymer transporter ExbD [Rhodocyclaceae bacterium]HMW51889.1 biopolymer transporter ExbD [Rhodocyclaceae bacterium]HMY49039.1 biopolymer transporter ExbD [Rhodocyclaceae bacterium]HMZ75951.1 biopolymer transporter ExbD [Rhodocyclaceae bacterium]
MNFRRGQSREEPEINLIPMIDVLLVIIIFLMLTTTYSRFAGLEINLPTADAQASAEKTVELNVAVTATGDVVVNKRAVSGTSVQAIAAALQALVPQGAKDPVVIINADAKATHQRVIDVMQAAQQAGLVHISFATQAAQR